MLLVVVHAGATWPAGECTVVASRRLKTHAGVAVRGPGANPSRLGSFFRPARGPALRVRPRPSVTPPRADPRSRLAESRAPAVWVSACRSTQAMHMYHG